MVHPATNKEEQNVLLYHPAIAVGKTSKFASPWKGPYVFEKCLNDVTFRINEEISSKQQSVHYDRLKLFFEPPPTSSVPTTNKPRNFWLALDMADTYKHIDGTLKRDECLTFLIKPSSIFTSTPAVGRTTASITTSEITLTTSSAPARREVARSPPVFSQSATLEQHTGNEVAIQSPTTRHNDIQPLIPENAFLYGTHSPRDIADAAARNLMTTPPANTSKMQLRPSTSSQRKAQPLFTSDLLT